MGIETALIVGSLALSAVSAMGAISASKQQGAATREAAGENLALQTTEFRRQQEVVNEISQEEKSDVIRRADQQLGSIRATAGEVGASASSVVRLLAEVGGVEGTDLSRIESNRRNKVESLQTSKRAAGQDYTNTVTASYNKQKTEKTGAILGFVSSGLQIGGAAYGRSLIRDQATNPVG